MIKTIPSILCGRLLVSRLKSDFNSSNIGGMWVVVAYWSKASNSQKQSVMKERQKKKDNDTYWINKFSNEYMFFKNILWKFRLCLEFTKFSSSNFRRLLHSTFLWFKKTPSFFAPQTMCPYCLLFVLKKITYTVKIDSLSRDTWKECPEF